MVRNDLENQLIGTTHQMSDGRVNYLSRMKQDAEFRPSDFIPYFGERNYEKRTLQHIFSSLFSGGSEGAIVIMDQIKKREGLLKDYNNFCLTMVLGASALGIIDLLSKP